jgi:hypothetical protein
MDTRACHWVSIGKWRNSRYSPCVTNENKNTCVGLDWLAEFEAFDCSIIYEKRNKTVPIYMQVWCWWELIHLTSRLQLRYSGIIDITVFVYNCIKVFNRLALWAIFPDPGNSVDLISTSQTELSLGSSRWRSSRRIAPRTSPDSLFKNQYTSSTKMSHFGPPRTGPRLVWNAIPKSQPITEQWTTGQRWFVVWGTQ